MTGVKSLEPATALLSDKYVDYKRYNFKTASSRIATGSISSILQKDFPFEAELWSEEFKSSAISTTRRAVVDRTLSSKKIDKY